MEPEQPIITEYHNQKTGKLFVREYRNSKGQYYRLDGPVYERYEDGENLSFCIWSKNGVFHRIGGPAIWIHPEYVNDLVPRSQYYINGIKYTKEQYEAYFKGIDNKEEQELLVDLGTSFD